MYDQNRQHEKAALYYQQEFMLDGTGPYTERRESMARSGVHGHALRPLLTLR